MDKRFLTTFLRLICILVFLCPVLADNRREDLIQDSVRRLLGVRAGIDRSEAPGRYVAPLPPRYVMDLYEKYRSGRTPMQGNTVRSILPMRDTIGDADMLIFNLTGINSSEQILQSKLYLLKKRKPKPGRKREGTSHFRIKIGSLPHMTSHRHIEVSLTRHKSEWHSYDITESVVQCRRHTKKGNNLLGLTLEVKRIKGSYRLSSFRRLLKQDSQPFVLIFSEDSNNQSKSPLKMKARNADTGIHGLLQAKADSLLPEDSSNQQESSEEHPIQDRSKRSIYQPIFVNNNSSGASVWSRSRNDLEINRLLKYSGKFQDLELLKTKIQNSGINRDSHLERHRLLSDLFNNSFLSKLNRSAFHNPWDHHTRLHPSGIFTGAYNNSFKLNFPKIYFKKVLVQNLVRWWKGNASTLNNTLKRDILETETGDVSSQRLKRSVPSTSATTKEESASSDHVAITFQTVGEKYKDRLNSTSRASARRRHRQRNRDSKNPKKKRRRNRKLPFWWTRHDNRLHSQDYGKLCQRKSLVVDFVKLGWGDWIISPKSFNAHYCSGGCSFPLIKNANPSNHAAIQSLVHAIGLSPNVPTPCCVPSLSSPLTLLYFDEHGNLVLKNYPNMIVEKCACR